MKLAVLDRVVETGGVFLEITSVVVEKVVVGSSEVDMLVIEATEVEHGVVVVTFVSNLVFLVVVEIKLSYVVMNSFFELTLRYLNN